MSLNKIPKSVKEIIDVFIHFSFKPLTYKTISGVLKRDTNTIVQRVKRNEDYFCLLYTSPSPRDRQRSRMPSSA